MVGTIATIATVASDEHSITTRGEAGHIGRRCVDPCIAIGAERVAVCDRLSAIITIRRGDVDAAHQDVILTVAIDATRRPADVAHESLGYAAADEHDVSIDAADAAEFTNAKTEDARAGIVGRLGCGEGACGIAHRAGAVVTIAIHEGHGWVAQGSECGAHIRRGGDVGAVVASGRCGSHRHTGESR